MIAEPRIINLQEIKVVGNRIRMTIAENRTTELWQYFMPRRKKISNASATTLYAIDVYDDLSFFDQFDPTIEFDKWAAVQVPDHQIIPEGMEAMVIPEGLYAVFDYKGRAGDAGDTYMYILNEWIPASEYRLDNRPHFALMGDRYKNDAPESEEELWFPVK